MSIIWTGTPSIEKDKYNMEKLSPRVTYCIDMTNRMMCCSEFVSIYIQQKSSVLAFDSILTVLRAYFSFEVKVETLCFSQNDANF